MAVSLDRARGFVYSNGVLWERTLFAYLFDGGPLEHVHRCLLAYKNPDGGFGHGLEHDLKCPDSNPLQIEYLLSILRDTGLPPGQVFDGTVAWLEHNREPDGSLKNPATLKKYPLAPWWAEWGGQSTPDSITGNLLKHSLCSPSLAASTQQWVLENLTLEKIRANEWLFMAYHAHDYFMNVTDFPNLTELRQATIENIITCAEAAPEKQYFVLFQFAPTPDAPIASHLPEALVKRNLDYLMEAQRDDGGWDDEHGLRHWQPYMSMVALCALKNWGRL
ncbi:MAG: hypothetical protein BroJett018_47580 [Chloroflexota bacterium]|nr:MAG: hypothetical protein BroJett018_47580 [Chloroflexota bacterium]